VPPLKDPTGLATEEDLGRLRFTDVSHTAGFRDPQSTLQLLDSESMSSGVAVGDVDGDGDEDVVLTRIGLLNQLMLNDGEGRFTDVGAQVGIGGAPGQQSSSATFGDIDNDGCLDLYLGGAGTTDSHLYRNDCAGSFTDVTRTAGVSLPVGVSEASGVNQDHGATFSDFDHDGDQDLLVLDWDTSFFGGEGARAAGSLVVDGTPKTCEAMARIRAAGFDRAPGARPNRSRLFRNNGDGSFEDATESVGLRLSEIAAFTGQFADIDSDGWEDLLIAGDFCTSRVYRNLRGEGFEDITAAAGVATEENGMGSVIADLNADGFLDWFVTSVGYPTAPGTCPLQGLYGGCTGNRVYYGRGDGTFVDGTDASGLRYGWWGWGAAVEDFNNDGRPEVVMTNGYQESESFSPVSTDPNEQYFSRFVDDPLRYFTTVEDRFVDGAPLLGLTDTSIGHGLVPFDFDLDGDLDILIANFGKPAKLYRNDLNEPNHWLRVQVVGPGSSTHHIGEGAKVLAKYEGGSITKLLTRSGSYESSKPLEVHFGLGAAAGPVEIEIWWPGADTPQLERVDSIDAVVQFTRR
jgi:hypothetical protein